MATALLRDVKKMPSSSETTERQVSISAAASLAGVSSHTLRKWESRHGVVVPKRTESGRRYYNDSQIEKLKLVKQLLDHGHSLSHLADLSETQLRELAQRHEALSDAATHSPSIVLVGPDLCHRLTEWGDCQVTAFPQDGAEWLQDQEDGRHKFEKHDALVIEADTLPPEIADKLVALQGKRFGHVVVVARMTSRRTRRQLRLQNVIALDAVVPELALLALIEQPIQSGQATSGSPQRFSSAELAAVAAMTPKLECECPNHIARLLLDIAAFEQYSSECEDSDPAEQLLHAYLGEVTGQARRLFETALVAVAEADNLEISKLVRQSSSG